MFYNDKCGGIITIGALHIRWGTEDAPTGAKIPWFIEILWWPAAAGKQVRTIYSTYTGG